MFDASAHDFSSQSTDQIAGRQADRTDGAGTIALADIATLLGVQVVPAVAEIKFTVRCIKPGEAVHRAGDKFGSIYVVRSGCFKTVSVDTAGNELVLGFPMGSDVIGLNGFDAGCYSADVIALDMSTIAVIPFRQLAQLARENPCVEHLLYSLFSRELAQKQEIAWLLGTLSAEQRLVKFLLDLAERFSKLGYSRTAFALRMTRQEIGSYLGLKLETVSRTLSAFAAAGLINIDRRQVTLRDVAGLRCVLESHGQRRGIDKVRAIRTPFERARQWLEPMPLAA